MASKSSASIMIYVISKLFMNENFKKYFSYISINVKPLAVLKQYILKCFS